MQKTPQTESEGEDDVVVDLAKLNYGDLVLFGDRSKPLTVVDIGNRRQKTRDGQELTTAIVRVQGDWDGAVPYVLAHVTKTLRATDSGYEVALEKQDEIVACKRGNLDKGNSVAVTRVSSGDEI